ncbi:Thioredoxin domain-containing protein 5, partial [Chytriomyces hyalinus]
MKGACLAVLSILVLLIGISAGVVPDFESMQQAALLDDAQILHLNAADFANNTIMAGGHWFLFFGSRGCSHCLALTPKWRQLQQERQEMLLEKGLRMAKVECMDNMQFCKDVVLPAFTRFPTLRMFRNGEMVDEFPGKDPGDIKEVDAFLMKHFAALPAMESAPTSGFNLEKSVAHANLVISKFYLQLNNPTSAVKNPLGTVLTVASFADLPASPYLIRYRHSVACKDAACKALDAILEDLATTMATRAVIAEIPVFGKNAADAKMFWMRDRDSSSGPQSLPDSGTQIEWVMGPLETRVAYEGEYSVKALVQFIEGFLRPPASVVQAVDVMQTLNSTEVSVLFLYDANVLDDSHLAQFLDVAASVQTRIGVYVTPDAAATFNTLKIPPSTLPFLAVLTEGGRGSYEVCNMDLTVLKDRDQKRQLKTWILERRHPLKLVVISFLNGYNASEIIALQTAAKEWKKLLEKDSKKPPAVVVFTWIDAQSRQEYIRSNFASVLGNAPLYPRHMIIDPSSRIAYLRDTQATFLTPEMFAHTLSLIANDQLK